MVVDVVVNRWDLLRFNIATVFKIRANLVVFLMFWGMAILFRLQKSGWSLSSIDDPIEIIHALVLAALGSLFLFAFMMVWMLLTVTDKSGWIGRRKLSIEDRGIREITQANDSIHMWESVHDVVRASNMLMIRVTQFTFLLLPMRGFDDPELFEPFCVEVTKKLDELRST